MDVELQRMIDDALRDYRDEREKLRDALKDIVEWWDEPHYQRWGDQITKQQERVHRIFARARELVQPNNQVERQP